jgi:hypothetical protein
MLFGGAKAKMIWLSQLRWLKPNDVIKSIEVAKAKWGGRPIEVAKAN